MKLGKHTGIKGKENTGEDSDRKNWVVNEFMNSLLYLKGMLTLAGMKDLMKQDPDMPDEAVDAEYIIDNIAVVGSIDTVTQKLQELYDDTGGFGTLLMNAHDWDDKDKMRRSMELMATEVIPQLP